MLLYEEQYINNLYHILHHGILEKNQRTGVETYRLPSTQIIVNLEREFPILQSKKVFWKTAADEILWMMQKCSNNINELHSHIWDKWADENGSLGKTYGYQVGKPVKTKSFTYKTQVDYVLRRLAANPSDRQCVIDMWDPQELKEMSLPPCVYSSIWSIINNRLNCMVVQRSADYPVGVPFDTLEHAILTHLFARHLNVQPGTLTHVMADSHIYKNQVDGVLQQLSQYENMDPIRIGTPRFSFKPGAPANFWEITINDFEILEYNPASAIKFEVIM